MHATHLVQILLPIIATPLRSTSDVLVRLRDELTERYGGVTAYTRAPAEGLWKPEEQESAERDAERDDAERDDVVMLEVMVDGLERAWWKALRERLERELDQDAILIRAIGVEAL